MMIPGVDYTERFSPVVSDASLRTQTTISLVFYKTSWKTMSCDIEAAFLEVGVNTEIYIEPYPAMAWSAFMTEEQRLESATLLEKSNFGNVDTVIKFFNILENPPITVIPPRHANLDSSH